MGDEGLEPPANPTENRGVSQTSGAESGAAGARDADLAGYGSASTDRDPKARAALLDDACSGDAALRRQVDAWLQMRVHVDKSPFALVERNEVRRCDQEFSENPGRFFIAASH